MKEWRHQEDKTGVGGMEGGRMLVLKEEMTSSSTPPDLPQTT